MHQEKSILAGQVVEIKENAPELGGAKILVEDYWDRVSGKSWRDCDGNPACISYAFRIGQGYGIDAPLDDEVIYGKIGVLGYLVHISELKLKEN